MCYVSHFLYLLETSQRDSMSYSSFSWNSFYYTGDLLEWGLVWSRSVIYNLMIAYQSFVGLCLRAITFTNALYSLAWLHLFQLISLKSWPVNSVCFVCLFVFVAVTVVLFSILVDTENMGELWKGVEKVSFLQLWQNSFPWRIGFCYGEDSEHIWQCLLFPFSCQSQQGIFCVSSCGKMWTTAKDCKHLYYCKFACQTFWNSSQLPCKSSYQFMAPAASDR